MKASKEIKKDEIKSNSEDVSKDIANIDHTNNKKLKKNKSAILSDKDTSKLKLVKIMSIPLISIFSVQLVAGVVIEGMLKNVPKVNPQFENEEQIKFDAILQNADKVITSENVNEFKNKPKINKLRITGKIKEIGAGAFKDFKYIEEIIFEKDCVLNKIGYEAFSGMTSLKKITFENPDSISILSLDDFPKLANDNTAFQFGRKEDNNVVNASKAEYLAMFNKATLTKAELSRVSTISYNAFKNNSSVKTLDLSDTKISYIGKDALNNSKIEHIVLSNQFENVEKGVFNDLTSLKSLKLGTKVLKIDDEAFQNSSISQIIFNDQLVEIGEKAFENSKLINVVTPNSLNKLARNAFANITTLETFVLNNVQTIGANIIANSKALKKLDLSKAEKITSDSIKDIQVEEFIVNDLVNKLGKEVLATYNIKKLVLSNLKIVDRSLFENNTSLKELELREGLQEIKNSAFKNVKLEKLTLPKSLRKIDAKAFENCGLSKGIDFGTSKNLEIWDEAFANNDFTKLNISAVADIKNDNVFEGCANITNISMHEDTILPKFFYAKGLLASRFVLKNIFIPKSLYDYIGDVSWVSGMNYKIASLEEWFKFFCTNTHGDLVLPYRNLELVEYGKGIEYIKGITPEFMLDRNRPLNIKTHDEVQGFVYEAFNNQCINLISNSITPTTHIGKNAFTQLGMINGKNILTTNEWKTLSVNNLKTLISAFNNKIVFSNDFDYDILQQSSLVANSVEFEEGTQIIKNISWKSFQKFGLTNLSLHQTSVKEIKFPTSVKKIVNSFHNIHLYGNNTISFSDGSLLETIDNSFSSISNCASLDFSNTKLREILGENSINNIISDENTGKLNLSLPLNLLDSCDSEYFNNRNTSSNFTSLNDKDNLSLNELKNPSLIKIFKKFNIKLNLNYLNPSFALTNHMFENSSFSEFHFGEGYKIIPESFLKNSYLLTKVTLPSSLTHIGTMAFLNTNLKELDFRHITNLQNIGIDAFGYTEEASNVKDLGIDTINGKNELSLGDWNNITNKQFVFGLFKGKVIATANTFNANKIPANYFNHKLFSALVINSGITTLENDALNDCPNLEHITYPTTLTNHGINLSGSKNKILSINGKTTINASEVPGYLLQLFAGKIIFSNNPTASTPRLKYVRSIKFENGVTQILANFLDPSCDTLEELELPNTLTTIGEKAFFNSKIQNLVIPESVKNIGKKAFGSSSLIDGISTINGKTILNLDDWLKPGNDIHPSAFNGFGGKLFISNSTLSQFRTNPGGADIKCFEDFYFSEIEFAEGITELTKDIIANKFSDGHIPRLRNIILPTSLTKITINLSFSNNDEKILYKLYDTVNNSSTLNNDEWIQKGANINTFASFGKELYITDSFARKINGLEKFWSACEKLVFANDVLLDADETVALGINSKPAGTFPFLKEVIIPDSIKKISINFASPFLETVNGKTELDLDEWYNRSISNNKLSLFSGFNGKVFISKLYNFELENNQEFTQFYNSKEIVFKEGIRYIPFLSISFAPRDEYKDQIIHIPSTFDGTFGHFEPDYHTTMPFSMMENFIKRINPKRKLERNTKFIIHAKDEESYNKKVKLIENIFRLCAQDKSLSFLSFEHSMDLIE